MLDPQRRIGPLPSKAAQSDKMDLNSLKDTVSNLTLYDIKAGVRKVQNGELLWPRRPAAAPVLIIPNSRHELHGNGGEGEEKQCCRWQQARSGTDGAAIGAGSYQQ